MIYAHHKQCVITKVMLAGLGVKKVADIGSAEQPGQVDLDADDEGPWEIDFDAELEDSVNEEVAARWVNEVMKDPAVSLGAWILQIYSALT